MRIKELFKKDISRNIKGVVIADETDDQIVSQELDEYVVTHELNGHFRKVISAYLASLDDPDDIAARSNMAVWVSGFFGSGKSHFLKILSYLLSKKRAVNPQTGEKQTALDFFEGKFGDRMLFADLKRMVDIDADVILFNIDAKADSSEGRDVLVRVFLSVFNEMQGYDGDYPHLADLERHLIENGVYEAFQEEFKRTSGKDWIENRDAFSFHEDHIVAALKSSLGMSEEAARNKFKSLGTDYSLSIEAFAEKVRDYLKTKPDSHRIIFLVDEVGQFIGQDARLMLNLQTIAEEHFFGTITHQSIELVKLHGR